MSNQLHKVAIGLHYIILRLYVRWMNEWERGTLVCNIVSSFSLIEHQALITLWANKMSFRRPVGCLLLLRLLPVPGGVWAGAPQPPITATQTFLYLFFLFFLPFFLPFFLHGTLNFGLACPALVSFNLFECPDWGHEGLPVLSTRLNGSKAGNNAASHQYLGTDLWRTTSSCGGRVTQKDIFKTGFIMPRYEENRGLTYAA